MKLPLAFVGVAFAAAALAASGRQQQPVFRSKVDIVRLDVLATADGRPIGALGDDDFEVTDNGVPQTVKVTAAGNVAVVLVLDTSGSVAGEALDNLVAASQTLVGLLGPQDTVSLVTFSDRPSLAVGSARDPAAVRRTLVGARAAGRTAVWDALYAGISQVAGRPERTMVLLLTDGLDNSSWMTPDQVTESLKRSETVVYVVQSEATEPVVDDTVAVLGHTRNAQVSRNRTNNARIPLQAVVNQSGGAVFAAESSARLPQQFAAVLREFRSRYLLMYEPTGVRRDDGWHRVQVRVKGRRAKVVARPGYLASSPPAK